MGEGGSARLSPSLLPFSNTLPPETSQLPTQPRLAHMDSPALVLSTATVLAVSCPGLGWFFFGRMVVAKRVLINVDFPSPDSPATWCRGESLVSLSSSLSVRVEGRKDEDAASPPRSRPPSLSPLSFFKDSVETSAHRRPWQ